jgi:hypothetical protein
MIPSQTSSQSSSPTSNSSSYTFEHSRAMMARNLHQEFCATFTEVDLADFDIFLDSDIIPEHKSHHYNLPNSLLSHTSLSPLTPSPSPSLLPSCMASILNSTTLQSTPSLNTVVMSAQMIIHMPVQGDRLAPQFDLQQPCKLHCYFADLDFTFGCTGISDHVEKKKHACHYVDVDTADLWKSISEFTGAATYNEFMKVVHTLYPGSEEECKWSQIWTN